jgi:hypothetical protein
VNFAFSPGAAGPLAEYNAANWAGGWKKSCPAG